MGQRKREGEKQRESRDKMLLTSTHELYRAIDDDHVEVSMHLGYTVYLFLL